MKRESIKEKLKTKWPCDASEKDIREFEALKDGVKLDKPWTRTDKASPPGERPEFPPMPKCKPPKNPGRDKSKDNEIKMMMAKQLLIAMISTEKKANIEEPVKTSCDIAEQIFNRFNK